MTSGATARDRLLRGFKNHPKTPVPKEKVDLWATAAQIIFLDQPLSAKPDSKKNILLAANYGKWVDYFQHLTFAKYTIRFKYNLEEIGQERSLGQNTYNW